MSSDLGLRKLTVSERVTGKLKFTEEEMMKPQVNARNC